MSSVMADHCGVLVPFNDQANPSDVQWMSQESAYPNWGYPASGTEPPTLFGAIRIFSKRHRDFQLKGLLARALFAPARVRSGTDAL